MTPGQPRHPQSRRAAFTLLELLIATAAFAIVLAAINSVFYSALRLRNKSAEAFDDDLAVQHTLSFLRRDIAGLVPPGGNALRPAAKHAVLRQHVHLGEAKHGSVNLFI